MLQHVSSFHLFPLALRLPRMGDGASPMVGVLLVRVVASQHSTVHTRHVHLIPMAATVLVYATPVCADIVSHVQY